MLNEWNSVIRGPAVFNKFAKAKCGQQYAAVRATDMKVLGTFLQIFFINPQKLLTKKHTENTDKADELVHT